MNDSLEARLNAIVWADFSTAYGPAVKVPDQLRLLAGLDKQAAFDASHELWCGLCHQHVYVSSAALPAMPFLLDLLLTADRGMAGEILDILLGFAKGTNRQRKLEFDNTIKTEVQPEEKWVVELRSVLVSELPRFRRYANSVDSEIAEYAIAIIEELGAQQ